MVYSNLFVASIKVDGKILRETRENGIDSVFIPFGSEYSIFMKNLSTKKVSVKISIDGKDVLNWKSLLINPNSESTIERFIESLNSGNKFKFIEKTNNIREHRSDRIDDGIVRIEYDFERKVNKYFDHQYNPYNFPFPYRYDQFTYKKWTTETTSGITVEGEPSNQSFSTTNDIITEGDPKVIVLKLVGEVENQKIKKPITVQTKLTCLKCGKSNNSINNFCYFCGTSLKAKALCSGCNKPIGTNVKCCPNCGAQNKFYISHKICNSCGYDRDDHHYRCPNCKASNSCIVYI